MKTPLLRLLCLVALGAALSARAQVLTYWTGTGTNPAAFNAADNWTAGAPDNSNPGTQFVAINSGTVNPSGAAVADILFVGNASGTATLNLGSGGSLSATFVSFGVEEGSSGTGTISNGASLTVSDGVVVGDMNYFGPGLSTGTTGHLTLSSGGAVNGSVTVASDALATGSLTVTGTGSTVTNGVSLGSGNATILIDDHASVNGGISGFSGSEHVTIQGGATVSGGLAVANSVGGTSTFVVDGGTLTGSGYINLAADPTSTATGEIRNGTHSIGNIFVGGGTTTLSVSNATLDGSAAVNPSDIGSGTGTSTLSLSNSSWTNQASFTIGSGTGTGVVTLAANSTSSHAGAVKIGQGPGTGTLNVTGGSTFTASAGLKVGNYDGGAATGTINVSGASTLNSTSSYLGVGDPSATGTVSLTGTGSFWTIANSGASTFEVGAGGTGTVTVSGGATLTNDSTATIGSSSGSNGSMLVTGSGSTWTSANTVTVSAQNGATGSITLANGGSFTITSGHLRLAEGTGAGTLNIGADALSAAATPGTLVLGSGSVRSLGSNGTVVFNHTSSSYVFDDSLEFGVKVLQKAGTTTLSGPVTGFVYSGGTTISGGTLKLGADDALGTGGLTLSGGTLDLNDFSQTAGTLNVTGNTFIDFTATSQLLLSDSSALSWSGILTVLNFDGSDSFRVGTTSGGLTGPQLNLIHIGGFYAQIDGAGYLSASSTAIPEPAAYTVIAGLTALGLAARRRRLLPVGPDR